MERAGGTIDADAYRRLARQLKRAGQFQEAEAAYLKAAELAPTDPAPLNYAGVIRSKHLGDHAGAEALYRRALALEPNYASAFYNWACAKARAGDDDAALNLLVTAVISDPTRYGRLARTDSGPAGPFQHLADDPRFQKIIGMA